MALDAETEAKYVGIIDSILAISDLTTISAKRVRKGIQAAVQCDITHQKDDINALIMARFDKFSGQETNESAVEAPAVSNGVPTPPVASSEPKATVNGAHNTAKESNSSASVSPPHKKERDASDELSDIIDEAPRPKKKVKRASPEDDDAAFAARLQAEENNRARPTRGGVVRKRNALPKATPKKNRKSKSTVHDDDDSDLESGSGADKSNKRKGAFHKPFNLSPALVEVVGESTLSRPQTVKRIWAYVKSNNLQDPNDKRQIRCDPALRAVFKQDSVQMFTMNKILSKHLYPIDE